MKIAAMLLTAVLTTAVVTTAGAAKKIKGEFAPLAGAAGLPIEGKAEIKRYKGKTKVKIDVRGLAPDTTYAAHLHNAPCDAANPGGGHYKHDPAGPAMPPNELWMSDEHKDPMAGVTTNHDGHAHGRGDADWVARPEAQSVVIHIPSDHTNAGGTKIACADL